MTSLAAMTFLQWFGGVMARKVTLRQQREQCAHPRLDQRRWLDEDGTPMVTSVCPDCPLRDSGHVHGADPTTWVTEEG